MASRGVLWLRFLVVVRLACRVLGSLRCMFARSSMGRKGCGLRPGARGSRGTNVPHAVSVRHVLHLFVLGEQRYQCINMEILTLDKCLIISICMAGYAFVVKKTCVKIIQPVMYNANIQP